MSAAVFLYDDAHARSFEPFASTRPIAEMRAGVALIRERWVSALQSAASTHLLAGPRHRDFDESNLRLPGAIAAPLATPDVIPAGSIIVNSRCVPALPSDIPRQAQRSATCSMWRSGGELAALRIRDAIEASAFEDGSLSLESLTAGTGSIGDVGGWWLDEVWDLVRLSSEYVAADVRELASQPTLNRAPIPPHVTVLGNEPVIVMPDVQIEPHVVLDAGAGPIYIERGSHVRAFTRITGPCYIGRDVQVMGGDIVACCIGDVSKVRGEMNSTVILGHSNKGHNGFVGHSYLGRWVNLGASTVTSNLKNTYGTVALWTPVGVRDTGMQFLGTMFGDHVKTGIGLRLTTGCVIGAGANVFDQMPPKVVSPFAWGARPPYATYQSDKFVETAARMMARRHVELSDRARRHLMSVHAGHWTTETTET